MTTPRLTKPMSNQSTKEFFFKRHIQTLLLCAAKNNGLMHSKRCTCIVHQKPSTMYSKTQTHRASYTGQRLLPNYYSTAQTTIGQSSRVARVDIT